MDLGLIDKAVEAYEKQAAVAETEGTAATAASAQADLARLHFFRGLFALQQARAQEVGSRGYTPAPQQLSDKRYIEGESLFLEAPALIDARDFVETCAQVAAYMADEAGLEPAAADALRVADWENFASKVNLDAAGQSPADFMEACLSTIDQFQLDANLPANIFMMVVAFALRAHVQEPAQLAFGAVSDDAKTGNHTRPLVCPVCGCPASASAVGLSAGIAGRDRVQFCSMCGTVWPFERIRCGVCGTKNQSKLHYFHIEGDPAHRLLNCEECGRYERVVFQDDVCGSLSMEVEDVVMARLDKVALDPRFRQEQ